MENLEDLIVNEPITKHYELLYIVPATYTDEEAQPIIDNVAELIKKAGGQISIDKQFGRKKLAYPIQHIHQGLYTLVEFDTNPDQIKGLNHTLRLHKDVLRHLIVQKTEREIAAEKKTAQRAAQRAQQETVTAKEIAEFPPAVKKEKLQEKLKERFTAPEPIKERLAEKKVSIEDLDKKLDELLEKDLENI